VQHCVRQIRKHLDDQFWRRTVVRTFGAAMEAETHVLSEILRVCMRPSDLNDEQKRCLENEKSCSALKRLRLTWEATANFTGPAGTTRIPDELYGHLDRVIRVRNRITH